MSGAPVRSIISNRADDLLGWRGYELCSSAEADDSRRFVVGVEQATGQILNCDAFAGVAKEYVENPPVLGSGQLDESITGHVPPRRRADRNQGPADGKLVDLARLRSEGPNDRAFHRFPTAGMCRPAWIQPTRSLEN